MREKLGTLIGGIEATVGPKLLAGDEVPAPFFGRGADLAALRRLLNAMRADGECRAVTIVGAAGMGKTRLIDEFAREVKQLDDPPIRLFRSTATKGSGVWASFTQLLTQRFEIGETNGLDEAKAAVRTQVSSVLDDRKVGDVLYLLGDLLDLEFPKSPLTKAFDDRAPETEILKRATLKSFLEADAAFGPICLVFDDLHLCQDAALSMLRFLVENLKAPVLILCAARPELLSRAIGLADARGHEILHLEPLTALDSAALIGSVLTPEGMTPMFLVEKARAITGGNPGRIEDTGRFFRDRGTLPAPSADAEAAVDSRLEQLDPSERALLQKAAVMGGVFWLGGLIVLERDGVAPPDEWSPDEEPGRGELAERLARLMERDYILRLPDSTFAGDEEYVFRHRAERNRIAQLTSVAEARKWHRLLADWLDSQPETRSHEEYLELLAEQREKAGASDSAAIAFLEAAGQARAHSSSKRELAYYERALALLGDDGHSRKLIALLRASELFEQLGRPGSALAGYREAAALAFRLNRRRLWEGAHLAAGRLAEEMSVHAEEVLQAAPEPPPVEAPPMAALLDASAAEEPPAEEAPAYEAHGEEAPAYEAPAEEAPAFEAPAEEAPAFEAPEEAPAYEAPAEEPRAYEAHAEESTAPEAHAEEPTAPEAPVASPPSGEVEVAFDSAHEGEAPPSAPSEPPIDAAAVPETPTVDSPAIDSPADSPATDSPATDSGEAPVGAEAHAESSEEAAEGSVASEEPSPPEEATDAQLAGTDENASTDDTKPEEAEAPADVSAAVESTASNELTVPRGTDDVAHLFEAAPADEPVGALETATEDDPPASSDPTVKAEVIAAAEPAVPVERASDIDWGSPSEPPPPIAPSSPPHEGPAVEMSMADSERPTSPGDAVPAVARVVTPTETG